VNILFLCHRFPFPPTSGAKIRPWHMIRHLARSHAVTVASLARSDDEVEQGRGIASTCPDYEMARVREPVQVARMVARLATTEPSSMGYFRSNALARRIGSRLADGRYDLVVVHTSSVAQYVERVAGVPKLLDFCDMDSQKWLMYARQKTFPLSLGYALEGAKLERAERRLAARFDMSTVATRVELETLERLGTARATDWFPNGVDADYFRPGATPPEDDALVFVGRMDYYPNEACMIEFCDRVMPRLRERRPAVRLCIVGADPTPAVRALSRHAGVTVTGSVPDVRPFLHRASAMVAPLGIARGTQNKLLEGMAWGVPVIASRLAVSGVDARAPDHLLAADTPDEIVDAVLRVLEHPSERERLARAGRERMLSHHGWDGAMRRLDAIVERTLGLAARPATRAAELSEAR
jgi:sugar transferase (PEP-CTERM/EpsH1 system associated)